MQIRTALLMLALLLSATATSRGATGELVESAKKEGQVVFYASMEAQSAQRLTAGWSAYVRFFRRHLRHPEDAEDAVQDFCLKALRAAVTLNDAGRIDAWLARILRNTLVDHYRRGAAR